MNRVESLFQPANLDQLKQKYSAYIPEKIWQVVEKFFKDHPNDFFFKTSAVSDFGECRVEKYFPHSGIYFVQNLNRVEILIVKIVSEYITEQNGGTSSTRDRYRESLSVFEYEDGQPLCHVDITTRQNCANRFNRETDPEIRAKIAGFFHEYASGSSALHLDKEFMLHYYIKNNAPVMWVDGTMIQEQTPFEDEVVEKSFALIHGLNQQLEQLDKEKAARSVENN